MLKRCQSLYLVVAPEVAAITHFGDISKLKQRVQEVLKNVVDDRVVLWAIDDMLGHKPSSLDEILEARKAKTRQKVNPARKSRDYNQTNTAMLEKVEKKMHGRDVG